MREYGGSFLFETRMSEVDIRAAIQPRYDLIRRIHPEFGLSGNWELVKGFSYGVVHSWGWYEKVES